MKRKSTNPQINGKPMSFVRLSSNAACYWLTGERGKRFRDTRGIIYGVREGTVYAVNKPRSRVKRLREERELLKAA